jgi:phage terminase large subunit-like protein
MVVSVLKGAAAHLPVRLVHASRGKAVRAEPVAAAFERGEAKFAGRFPELEDQLSAMVTGGDRQGQGGSPDGADAMVWAMTELMRPQREPRVRVL